MRAAAQALAAHSPTPRLDAELLMAHALGIGRDRLLLAGGGGTVPAGFAALVARRIAQEPVAYITGAQAFWTLELAVSPAVLIPRPDSETLIEAAVGAFAGRAPPRSILDLGTGSGALLLAALSEWPEARGTGVDASAAALAVAQENAARLGLADRVRLIEGLWGDGGMGHDLILCNPPYIGTAEPLPASVVRYEPAGALFAGADGLDDYRRIAPILPAALAPGGVACIEIGATQAQAVGALMAAAGLSVSVRRDLAGHDRCLIVRMR